MNKLKNLFNDVTNDELIVLYEQYLRMQKTGYTQEQPLRTLIDDYLQIKGAMGLIMATNDLLSKIANEWYDIVKMSRTLWND